MRKEKRRKTKQLKRNYMKGSMGKEGTRKTKTKQKQQTSPKEVANEGYK